MPATPAQGAGPTSGLWTRTSASDMASVVPVREISPAAVIVEAEEPRPGGMRHVADRDDHPIRATRRGREPGAGQVRAAPATHLGPAREGAVLPAGRQHPLGALPPAVPAADRSR